LKVRAAPNKGGVTSPDDQVDAEQDGNQDGNQDERFLIRRHSKADAIEDGTAIKGRAAAVGWRGRGKDQLNQAPLFVGEVHRIFE